MRNCRNNLVSKFFLQPFSKSTPTCRKKSLKKCEFNGAKSGSIFFNCANFILILWAKCIPFKIQQSLFCVFTNCQTYFQPQLWLLECVSTKETDGTNLRWFYDFVALFLQHFSQNSAIVRFYICLKLVFQIMKVRHINLLDLYKSWSHKEQETADSSISYGMVLQLFWVIQWVHMCSKTARKLG